MNAITSVALTKLKQIYSRQNHQNQLRRLVSCKADSFALLSRIKIIKITKRDVMQFLFRYVTWKLCYVRNSSYLQNSRTVFCFTVQKLWALVISCYYHFESILNLKQLMSICNSVFRFWIMMLTKLKWFSKK